MLFGSIGAEGAASVLSDDGAREDGWWPIFFDYRPRVSALSSVQCFDTVRWQQKGHPACENLLQMSLQALV